MTKQHSEVLVKDRPRAADPVRRRSSLNYPDQNRKTSPDLHGWSQDYVADGNESAPRAIRSSEEKRSSGKLNRKYTDLVTENNIFEHFIKEPKRTSEVGTV